MITLDEWRSMAPGFACVDKVSHSSTGVAHHKGPAGRHDVIEFEFTETSACELPQELDRVLAVQVRSRGEALECTVLGTFQQRPLRVPIDLPQALALADFGVHTVFGGC